MADRIKATHARHGARSIAFERTISSTSDYSTDDATSAAHATADDRYESGDEVARGGLGRVFEARDLRLDRPVAIKELIASTPALRERFQREVAITARLQHPGIVPVYDAGMRADGEPYYVMKLLSGGRTLKEVVAETRDLTSRLALLPNVIAVADAIAYGHSVGIIHRDLKPSNVLIGPFGETLVIDWGLAKDLTRPAADEPSASPYRATSGAELTSAGSVMGTPQYMAPEQARGEAVDKRADVYSLGAVLHYVLSGMSLFRGAASREVLDALRSGAAPTLSLDGIEPDLVAIVRKATAPDACRRYATAGELVEDLRRFHAGQLVRAHDYSAATLVWRWVRRYRALLAVTAASIVGLSTMAILGVHRIENARDTAQRERAAAIAQRNQLILLQARASLEHDPTMALAWLKRYPADGSDWSTVQTLAAEARSLGVARHILKTGLAHDAAFLPDGRSVVLAGFDSNVTVWDVVAGVPRAHMRLDSTGVAVSPADGLVAIGGVHGEVVLWDATSGRIRELGRHGAATLDLAFSSDGRFLASAARGDLRIWNVAKGTYRRLPAPNASFEHLKFSRDGVLFASGSDGSLVTASVDGDTKVRSSHRGAIDDLALSTDGTQVATAGADGTVRIWSVGDEHGHVLVRHSAAVTHVQLAANRVIATTADNVVSVWSTSGRLMWRSPQPAKLTQLSVAPDATTFATSDTHGSLRVWYLATGESTALFGHKTTIQALAHSADGTLLSAGMDDTSRVWNSAQLPPQPILDSKFDAPMTHVVFSRDGTRFATDGGRSVHVCVVASGACRTFEGHQAAVYGVAFSPDERSLISSGWDGTARIWDVESGAAQTFKTDAALVRAAVFTPDGRRILVAGSDGVVYLWRVGGGEPTRFRGHDGEVLSLASSPTNDLFASGGIDGTVRLWSATSGHGRVLGSHDKAVAMLAFSPDGRRLASGGRDGVVELFDVLSGSHRLLGRHRDTISTVAFSPDGHSLLTSSWDGTAHVWSLASDRKEALVGHEQRVRMAAWAPNGRIVATSSDDRTVRLWDLASGAVEVAQAHGDKVRAVSFSPDGALVATASDDRSVRLWKRATPSVPRLFPELSTWIMNQTTATVQ